MNRRIENGKHPARPIRNRLLAAMPANQYERLRPHFRGTKLRPAQLLVSQREPLSQIVFPDDGVISLVATLEDGATLEVGMVGYDGALGYQIIFDRQPMPWSAQVQVAGFGQALDVEVFLNEMTSRRDLWTNLFQYAGEAITQSAKLALCNRHHSVQQRCARWLLMAQDRVGLDHFRVTHDVIAVALGVYRPSISLAQENLKAAGLIAYGHGQLSVIDRTGLQDAACGCYPSLKV